MFSAGGRPLAGHWCIASRLLSLYTLDTTTLLTLFWSCCSCYAAIIVCCCLLSVDWVDGEWWMRRWWSEVCGRRSGGVNKIHLPCDRMEREDTPQLPAKLSELNCARARTGREENLLEMAGRKAKWRDGKERGRRLRMEDERERWKIRRDEDKIVKRSWPEGSSKLLVILRETSIIVEEWECASIVYIAVNS